MPFLYKQSWFQAPPTGLLYQKKDHTTRQTIFATRILHQSWISVPPMPKNTTPNSPSIEGWLRYWAFCVLIWHIILNNWKNFVLMYGVTPNAWWARAAAAGLVFGVAWGGDQGVTVGPTEVTGIRWRRSSGCGVGGGRSWWAAWAAGARNDVWTAEAAEAPR